MHKILTESNLHEQTTARVLVALSLVASLAAFGCTTNKMPGAGQPYTGGPGFGPTSPTSNLKGSTVPVIPPPMTSSYRGVATPRASIQRLSADEAAAIMAQYQTAPRVRVLGPVDPGPAIRPYVSDGIVTGQVVTYGNVRALTTNGKVVMTNVQSQ